MRYKNAIVLICGLVLSGLVHAQTPPASNGFPILSGSVTPLTIKLKDLDSNWRVFTAASSDYTNILATAMGGGGNKVFTKGDTVSIGNDVFLVTYKAEAPDMTALFAGGGPPKPKPLTSDSVLRLSLLNLHALSAMDGIRVFDLKEQTVAPAKSLLELMQEAQPSKTVTTMTTTTSGTAAEPVLLKNGSRAPDFVVHDDGGRPIKLSSYRGKVVVLDFWATWCGPCQESLPATNKVAAKFSKKGVVFLGVNVWDKKEAFHQWLPEHRNYSSIKFAIDPRGAGQDVATKLYHVSGIPTQYILDRKGRVVASTVGYDNDESGLENGIKKALAK